MAGRRLEANSSEDSNSSSPLTALLHLGDRRESRESIRDDRSNPLVCVELFASAMTDNAAAVPAAAERKPADKPDESSRGTHLHKDSRFSLGCHVSNCMSACTLQHWVQRPDLSWCSTDLGRMRDILAGLFDDDYNTCQPSNSQASAIRIGLWHLCAF